jgi:hypothetical protein
MAAKSSGQQSPGSYLSLARSQKGERVAILLANCADSSSPISPDQGRPDPRAGESALRRAEIEFIMNHRLRQVLVTSAAFAGVVQEWPALRTAW